VPFDARVAYDPARNVLYLNFERLEIKTPQMVDAIGAKVAEVCEPIAAQGRRVQAVVNYEGFVLDRDLEDRYAEMVRECVERYYSGVTRFTTSAFMRAKLGDALARRKLAPYIFESEAEAVENLAMLASPENGNH
jgi:propionate CoA-transferase